MVATSIEHSLIRLSKFIYDQYPESRPLSSPLPPRCSESLFAPADPPESSRPRFRLYPRVREVMDATHERAVSLSHKLKPSSEVLPKKNGKHTVADELKFSTAPAVNLDFSRLTENESVSNKLWGSIIFLEMESVSRALLEANSNSLWLMSELLSQLKRDGFSPSDPALYEYFFNFRLFVLTGPVCCCFV